MSLDTAKTADYSPIVSDADTRAPCGSNAENTPEIKFTHGGYRPGAGRPPARSRRDPAPDRARWYCVRSRARADLLADMELRLAGFEVFAPTVFKRGTPAFRGFAGQLRMGKIDRIEPLFPRYLFCRFNAARDDWRRIPRLPGIEHLFLASPYQPGPIPDAVIASIRAMCAENDCIYPDQTAARLARGDRGVVIAGPFAALAGDCEWSDGQRVRMLLEVMGRLVRVTLDEDAVDRLEA